MITPNGDIRIIRYNKNTKLAMWNLNGKHIAGDMFEQLGKTYFLPHTEEGRIRCMFHKAKRVRYPVPQTYDEWRANQREIQSRAYQKKKIKKP
jgi:hypothetical protein